MATDRENAIREALRAALCSEKCLAHEAAIERVMSLCGFLEPPAEAQGKWTREAPTEAGWYWCVDVRSPRVMWVESASSLDLGYAIRYWSVPLVEPPPPTDASEEEAQ